MVVFICAIHFPRSIAPFYQLLDGNVIKFTFLVIHENETNSTQHLHISLCRRKPFLSFEFWFWVLVPKPNCIMCFLLWKVSFIRAKPTAITPFLNWQTNWTRKNSIEQKMIFRGRVLRQFWFGLVWFRFPTISTNWLYCCCRDIHKLITLTGSYYRK